MGAVRNGINKVMAYSIYIHIPFCQRRCNYCDFVTYAGMGHYLPVYVDSLIEEFRIVIKQAYKKPVKSIYFGGGTPSLVPIKAYEKILIALSQLFYLTEDCEISIEANPGTLNFEYLKGLKTLGFNRISLGCQSMQDLDLRRLGRIHTSDDIYTSFENSRRVGFANINFDLIFGLPWQSLHDWKDTLKKALELNPEHFSVYSLIIEPGTKLFHWYQKGLIALQDQDKEGDLFESSMAQLSRAGYEHYEISNWAKKDRTQDFQCRHNLQYWRGLPYLGFGVGAHGYARDVRTANVIGIPDYCDRIVMGKNHTYDFPKSPANKTSITLEKMTQMREYMIMGLRLIAEGVSPAKFFDLFSCSILDVFEEEIITLLDEGLLQWGGGEKRSLKLTKRGVMLGNQVFMAFV